ncbi:unnamed protein product [Effrenium voratum]|uniref:Uncharacterized protein n=1 Tax=Effrenium voratum TaxID=2562239 RepID=A0AA36NJW5_9DINO|nr:unnamed protein product [Effrenium voratum]
MFGNPLHVRNHVISYDGFACQLGRSTLPPKEKRGLGALLAASSLACQAVLGERSKVVCLRFGQDFSPDCMKMDEVLSSAAQAVEQACVIYAVDLREVPEAVAEFQLNAPAQLMFFFRGKPLELDLGRGPQRKIDFVLSSRQEFLDMVEAVCRGAQQGMHLIVAPRDYSMQFRY